HVCSPSGQTCREGECAVRTLIEPQGLMEDRTRNALNRSGLSDPIQSNRSTNSAWDRGLAESGGTDDFEFLPWLLILLGRQEREPHLDLVAQGFLGKAGIKAEPVALDGLLANLAGLRAIPD